MYRWVLVLPVVSVHSCMPLFILHFNTSDFQSSTYHSAWSACVSWPARAQPQHQYSLRSCRPFTANLTTSSTAPPTRMVAMRYCEELPEPFQSNSSWKKYSFQDVFFLFKISTLTRHYCRLFGRFSSRSPTFTAVTTKYPSAWRGWPCSSLHPSCLSCSSSAPQREPAWPLPSVCRLASCPLECGASTACKCAVPWEDSSLPGTSFPAACPFLPVWSRHALNILGQKSTEVFVAIHFLFFSSCGRLCDIGDAVPCTGLHGPSIPRLASVLNRFNFFAGVGSLPVALVSPCWDPGLAVSGKP